MNMRKWFIVSGIVVLVMLTLAAGLSLAQDLYEPNDSFSEAWSLETPTTIQSYIYIGDVDYFEFFAKNGSLLYLSLYDLPADYNLCLYGPSKMEPVTELECSANGGATSEVISRTAKMDGTYYAYVYGAEGAHDDSNPYALSIGGAPDLTVTDVWLEAGFQQLDIHYQVRNVGTAEVISGHVTALSIDDQLEITRTVNVTLAIGERWSGPLRSWSCSGQKDVVRVCADSLDTLPESDETNNCITETWKCDPTPPTITSGPVVSQVLQTSAVITWTTDEGSDSVVAFGRYKGAYEGQEADAALTKEHELFLAGLQPATVYHYVASSTDASGNTVTSERGFFKTAPEPAGEPPSLGDLTVARLEGNRALYTITVPVSDTVGVDRVEFYLDDKLIGIDYASARGTSPPTTSFSFDIYLDPVRLDLSQDAFFGQSHTITAHAFNYGQVYTETSLHLDPQFLDPQITGGWCHLDIWQPPPDHVIYINGTTAPAGTTQSIYANAYELEWGCSWVSDPFGFYEQECGDMSRPVDRVEFYIGSSQTPDQVSSSPLEHLGYHFNWDISGLPVGVHDYRIRAVTDRGTFCESTQSISVTRGTPDLQLARSVVRTANYFRVTLTLENQATATVPASVSRIQDNVRGFQPLITATTYYSVTPEYDSLSRYNDVWIDLFSASDDYISLEPGESISVTYLAVPILYHDSDVFQYGIGTRGDVLVYDGAGAGRWAFERPRRSTSLATDLASAHAGSNYLIVTHPGNLFTHYGSSGGVDRLLAKMAELAQRKSGILGYVSYVPGSIPGLPAVLNQIQTWGAWMRGSDGVRYNYLSNGYLLLVGETDILPAFFYIDEGIANATSGAGWGYNPVDLIPLSDNGYADVNGDSLPDLIVGRLIGESAAQLLAQIQTSLDELFWRDGATDALVASGVGDGESSFEENADRVVDLLDDEFTVSQMYGSDYASDAARLAEFRTRAPDKDIIFYRDHGSANCWSHTVCEDDFPVDFGDSHPFAFGSACSTGDYEEGDDVSIAEAFLDSGAGVYIGATERSSRSVNNPTGRRFFERLTSDTHPLGQTFRETKRESDISDDRTRLWVLEYNLYGDPKYGGLYRPSTGAVQVRGLRASAGEVQSSLDVTVPQYQVTTFGDLDYVDIPGPSGHILLTPDEPRVPIYVTSTIYAEGYKVQDVDLSMRSGSTTTTGLILPTISGAPNGDSGQPLEATGATSAGWYPEDIYDWRVTENPDGSSTLFVTIYPFYYNAATTSAMFYQNYSFDIQVISSTVAIESLTTDKSAYPQGDEVLVDLWLNNSGDAQDVIVDAEVQTLGGEVVEGLLLRSLQGLTGTASFSPRWDSTGFAVGDYRVEVEVRDGAGNVLDRKVEPFRLGVCSGQVTALTATPTLFQVGDTISTSLTFSNTGTVPITGTAVIKIQDEGGEAVETFKHEVTNLAPDDAVSFDDGWDTSGADRGSYNIIGYVLYASKSTSPEVVTVGTEAYIYLPVILKSG